MFSLIDVTIMSEILYDAATFEFTSRAYCLLAFINQHLIVLDKWLSRLSSSVLHIKVRLVFAFLNKRDNIAKTD